jgi:GTPase
MAVPLQTRCGFVAVIGAPNAGKSTLINHLVGTKVSIVSPKVQTTRTLVRGIVNKGEAQIVFVDTPGIFAPKKKLEKAIVAAAWEGQAETDLIMLVVDVARLRAKETHHIIEKLKETGKTGKCILVLNKIDKVSSDTLPALAKELNDKLDFSATFMISALKGDGTDDLLSYLAAQTPEGPWMYPEDQVSDMPLRLLAAEITREKLFYKLHQELPHALTVETENWEEFDNGSIKISQVIYVAKNSYKGMVLGKGGSLIKAVGKESREELREILGTDVHLKLFVKLREAWMDNPEHYSIWGLDNRF